MQQNNTKMEKNNEDRMVVLPVKYDGEDDGDGGDEEDDGYGDGEDYGDGDGEDDGCDRDGEGDDG